MAALAVQTLPATARLALDWQPSLAWAEPWRWWTAAFVHYGAGHLVANLAGCAVLAALGAAARLPGRWALAWVAAWPLGHLLLLEVSGPAHYGGLSGLLHAGVAVAAVALMTDQRRGVGAAIAAGLAIKLWLEQTAGPAIEAGPLLDVPVASVAHITGALGGGFCAVLAAWISRRRATIRR